MLVTLKDKGQVTIPAEMREKLNVRRGDVFEVVLDQGNIVMKPKDVVSRQRSKKASRVKGPDIGPWIGAARGLFTSTEEIDAFIAAERGKWD